MPPAIVNRLNAAMVKVIPQKELTAKLAEGRVVAWPTKPEKLRAHISAELDRWTRLARKASIQPE